MSKLIVAGAIVGLLVGGLAGYIWWGVPTSRLQAELHDAQSNADRLTQELGESRAENQRFRAQLQSAHNDLRSEKEVTSRLHTLVSEGKK